MLRSEATKNPYCAISVMKSVGEESSYLQDAQDIKDTQDKTFRENLENLVVEYILREERS